MDGIEFLKYLFLASIPVMYVAYKLFVALLRGMGILSRHPAPEQPPHVDAASVAYVPEMDAFEEGNLLDFLDDIDPSTGFPMVEGLDVPGISYGEGLEDSIYD